MKYLILAAALALSACGGGDYNNSTRSFAAAKGPVTQVAATLAPAALAAGKMQIEDVKHGYNASQAIVYPQTTIFAAGVVAPPAGYAANLQVIPYVMPGRTNVAIYNPQTGKVVSTVTFRQYNYTGGTYLLYQTFTAPPGGAVAYGATIIIRQDFVSGNQVQYSDMFSGGTYTVIDNVSAELVAYVQQYIQDISNVGNPNPRLANGGATNTCEGCADVAAADQALYPPAQWDGFVTIPLSDVSIPFQMYNPAYTMPM